jgi:hypothetical protein
LRRQATRRLGAGLGLVLVVVCAALWRAKSSPRPSDERGAEAGAIPAAPPDPSAAPASPAAAGRVPASAPGPLSPAQLAELDEARLMARLRMAAGSDPALAVQLARDGNRRFRDSPDAPERTSILIHALAGLDRSMEARGEAEEMVNHDPDSEWVREIERFTGAHRHRNIRVNDAGVLEYQ